MFSGAPSSNSEGNRLIVQVQPAEGIQLHFYTKVPDAGMKLLQTDLSFQFRAEFQGPLPEAYQRLLLDVISGDASLFTRSDEVELAWKVIDPIHEAWKSTGKPAVLQYEPHGWGPTESNDWIAAQGRQWFDYCPVLH